MGPYMHIRSPVEMWESMYETFPPLLSTQHWEVKFTFMVVTCLAYVDSGVGEVNKKWHQIIGQGHVSPVYIQAFGKVHLTPSNKQTPEYYVNFVASILRRAKDKNTNLRAATCYTKEILVKLNCVTSQVKNKLGLVVQMKYPEYTFLLLSSICRLVCWVDRTGGSTYSVIYYIMTPNITNSSVPHCKFHVTPYCTSLCVCVCYSPFYRSLQDTCNIISPFVCVFVCTTRPSTSIPTY